MTTVIPQQHESPPQNWLKRFWARSVVTLVVVSLVGLTTTNVLTLIDDDAHAAAYRTVATVLTSVIGDAVVSKIMSHSPTATKDIAVARATKSLETKNGALERSRDEILAKHVSLRKLHRELESRHVALGKVYEDTKAQHKELEAKHTTLEKAHKDSEAKHTSLKAKSGKQSASASRILPRIARRAVTNAFKQVASFAAEIVPVAGVAAIVALTASDLYDDCQSLKDVNELNAVFDLDREDEDKVCGLKVPSLR